MIHQFSNGLVLLAEEMSWCESVSYTLRIPCGCVDDPVPLFGLANLTCEMITRGADELDNRQLSEAFENLGSERGEAVCSTYTGYSSQTLASHFEQTLELTAKMVRRPQLRADQLAAAKQVVIQEILALEDDPEQKIALMLDSQFFPDPLGRPVCGETSSVKQISINDIRQFHRRFYQPQGAILSVAGRFDSQELLEHVERLFGDWTACDVPELLLSEEEKDRTLYLPFESSQTQIDIAFSSVPFGTPDYLLAWSGIQILGGGVSSRFFTELREKRGLCYYASSSYNTIEKFGCVFCSCASTAAHAQQALDLLLEEIGNLRFGINEEELKRLKIRAKCSLVMQQESTASRCYALAQDWRYFGRIRSKEEIEQTLTKLTVERINDYWKPMPIGPMYIAVLGQEPLNVP